jgi:hypothetical protein
MLEYLKTMAQFQEAVYRNNNQGKAKLLNYTSVEDFVLDRGSEPKNSEPLTQEEYNYLMKTVERCIVSNFPYRQCFYNAQVLLLADWDERLTYVEGFCQSKTMPVHHGWLELDGKVIDVTYSTTDRTIDEPPPEDLKDRVLGSIPSGWEYIGVSFQRSEVIDFLTTHQVSDGLIGNFRQIEQTFNLPRKGAKYAQETQR